MATLLSTWIVHNIEAFGYLAIFVLMALESANIPIPSEVTLPFAGFLVAQGRLDFNAVAWLGALGCVAGSIFSYWLGRRYGRAFVNRFGKWFFLSPKEVALGDKWMSRYGNGASFFSRLLPIVRTFISFIAGIWRTPFMPFVVLTFIGSLLWSYFLTYLGVQLGAHWEVLHPYWQKFEFVIIAAAVAVVVIYIWHHWKSANKPKA
ncbi:MAG: DedA family protein [Patescibacteria group bacterium]